jgi:hypothetical protein
METLRTRGMLVRPLLPETRPLMVSRQARFIDQTWPEKLRLSEDFFQG